jgi:uncharacterized phage infection (PIP) family protein YhgE
MYNIPIGLDGAALFQGFREMSDGLDKVNAKAKETGDSLNKSIGKGAEGSEAMNKSLRGVAGNMQYVKTVTGTLSEAINGYGVKARYAFDEKPVSAFTQRMDGVKSRLQQLAGAVISFGRGAKEGFNSAVKESRTLDKSIDELNKEIDELRRKMSATKDAGLLKGYRKDIIGMEKEVSRLNGKVGGAGGGGIGGSLMGGMKMLAGGVVAAFAVDKVIDFGKRVFDVRSKFQQLEVAFKVMLGSKEKADQMMKDIADFAATTPFSMEEVAGGARQLMAYGFAQEEVIDQMRTLGDVAAGVGAPIGDLIYLFGTLKASGRVTMMDINQFAGRGIPIYSELAKVLNTSKRARHGWCWQGRFQGS